MPARANKNMRRTAEWALALALLLFSSPVGSKAQATQLWGTVTDAQTRTPLAADVSIVRAQGPHIQFSYARTDATGGYELGCLPPGKTLLVARAERYGFAVEEIVLEPGQILGPVDFALEKAASVWGRFANELVQWLPAVHRQYLRAL